MAVIVPCGGDSTRYPNIKPKYLLSLTDGKMMYEKCIENYLDREDIFFIVPVDHEKKFGSISAMKKTFSKNKNVKIFEINKKTQGPAETVYLLAKTIDKSIIIQDCDSLFDLKPTNENFVVVVNLQEHLNLFNVASKSFAILDNQNILKNIVEKKVSSNLICCGGYGFKSSKDYCRHYESISASQKDEIFVSHIIKSMLLSGHIFSVSISNNFLDLGTLREYLQYKEQHKTYFINLDGAFFYKQSMWFENDYSKEPKAIVSAVKYFKQKHDQGSSIYFITNRPEKFRNITENKLISLGFSKYKLLMEIPESPMVIVNDYNLTNSFPTAQNINAPSDSEEFWKDF